MIYGYPLQVQVHVMASGELLEGSAYIYASNKRRFRYEHDPQTGRMVKGN